METTKFVFNAGMLVRNQAITNIKNEAFKRNIKIEIDEDKGFFDSNYRITLNGIGANNLANDVSEWIDKLNEVGSESKCIWSK